MSAFQYQGLDGEGAFRVLALSPGIADTPLHGDIITTSLKEAPDYSAISYVWGSEEKPHYLQTPNGRLLLTRSLFSALLRLRSTEDTILLWTDAICINQEDHGEKDRQVRLMRKIFENATRVHAYLGETYDASDVAYELIEKLGTIDLAAAFGVGPKDHINSKLYGEDKRGILPPLDDESWEAARALLRRPWFLRVWIVQEVAVAREIELYCGSWSMDWSVLAGAIIQSINHALPLDIGPNYDKATTDTTEKGFRAMYWLIWIRGGIQRDHRWSLLDLLTIFKYTESLRARDHLFGLLGVAADGAESCFDPDYAGSFDTTLKRYAGAFIEKGMGNQMLTNAGLSSLQIRFPSWIPDWTKGSLNQQSLTRELPGLDLYRASGDTRNDMSLLEGDDSVLSLTAGFFDVVKILGTSYSEHADAFATINPLDPLIDRMAEVDRLLENMSSYPTGESISNVHWRTLIGNRSELNVEAPESFGLLFHRVKPFLDRKKAKDLSFDTKGEEYAALWPYLHRLIKTFEMMRFGVTEKGYVGLFADNTRPGDAIFILHGSNTPYVLRKSESYPENYFYLIGQSYVHGIMKGEFVESDKFSPEAICII